MNKLEKDISEMDALELLCLVMDCPAYISMYAYKNIGVAIRQRVEILNAEREDYLKDAYKIRVKGVPEK